MKLYISFPESFLFIIRLTFMTSKNCQLYNVISLATYISHLPLARALKSSLAAKIRAQLL